MKNYTQMKTENLDAYNKMMEEYKTLTESPEFREIAYSMPFEFLNASHICQSLQLYADMEEKGEKPKMNFSCADDAIVFYKNLIQLKHKKEALLNGANYIMGVSRKADEINELVSENPYLGKSFCVQGDEELFTLARKCLEEIPKYQENMTKKFRYCFLESAIACTDKDELSELVKAKIIAPSDLDHVNLSGDDEYVEKISLLCDLLKHPYPLIKSYDVNLRGVAFTDETGVSRQKLLEELKKYAAEGKMPNLKAEPYIYKPEVGQERQAVKIIWDGKIIGVLAQDVVDQIYNEFDKPQFTAVFKEVTGGPSEGRNSSRRGKEILYGCNIKLGIVAPQFKVAEKKEETAPVMEEPAK